MQQYYSFWIAYFRKILKPNNAIIAYTYVYHDNYELIHY